MLIIRKKAEEDIQESYNWYEQQTVGLGERFINELESIFKKIQENPQQYNRIYIDYRRALCSKFPYSIYFIEEHKDIIIIAVLHQRRNPAFWQERFLMQ